MGFLDELESGIALITGHYGCGKTNLSINLALELARDGKRVMLVDLDIVNPYFRASDSTKLLEDAGVEVVAPNFAGTTLDNPALSPAIMNAIERGAAGDCIALIDVGGDPDGASALGRFSKRIAANDYRLIYVINQRRLQTRSVSETVELLREIEQISRLRATDIAANTHLGVDTTASIVFDAIPFAAEVAHECGLPLAFVTATSSVAEEVKALMDEGLSLDGDDEDPLDDLEILPVDIYVKTPWM
ncbi:MAG: ParA family protein [bacterium]|nr:ParA family protein [bacterium]